VWQLSGKNLKLATAIHQLEEQQGALALRSPTSLQHQDMPSSSASRRCEAADEGAQTVHAK
jgi:hypothetical protein